MGDEATVHQPSQLAPDTSFLTMTHFTEMAESVPKLCTLRIAILVEGTAVLLSLHHLVEHKCRKDTQCQDNMCLQVDRGTQKP